MEKIRGEEIPSRLPAVGKVSFIFLKDGRLLLAKTHDLFTSLIKEKKLLELPASSI